MLLKMTDNSVFKEIYYSYLKLCIDTYKSLLLKEKTRCKNEGRSGGRANRIMGIYCSSKSIIKHEI